MAYGRMRRRRSRRPRANVLMHVPHSIGNNQTTNTALSFFAAHASGQYSETGAALTEDRFEQADRLQQVVIGNHIDTIIYNVDISDVTGSGIIEYAIFKIERAHVVPAFDGVLLPPQNTITTAGLQAAMRQYQPGRILKFGTVAVAAEQPRTFSVKGNYKKFKMSKLRTGDYYGIAIYNRTSAAATITIQARYQSYT